MSKLIVLACLPLLAPRKGDDGADHRFPEHVDVDDEEAIAAALAEAESKLAPGATLPEASAKRLRGSVAKKKQAHPRAGLLSGETVISGYVERPAIVTSGDPEKDSHVNLTIFLDGTNDSGDNIGGFTRDPKSGDARAFSAERDDDASGKSGRVTWRPSESKKKKD